MAHYKIIGNDTEIDRILNRDFVSFIRKGYIEVGDDKVCLPSNYLEFKEKIEKFELYDDDVLITGQPKSGTTWLQELVWLLINDVDYVEGSKAPIFIRSPQIEFEGLFDFKEFSKGLKLEQHFAEGPFQAMVDCKRPRCIKTHLNWSLLPEQIKNGTVQPKMIFILRNPADCCVSLYYHSQTTESYKGSFENFCELFLAGRVPFGPFWQQILSFWNERDRENILFVKFKEIKEDRIGLIRKIVKFLGKTLTEEQICKLSEHMSFESMKKNPAVNHEEVSRDLFTSGVATSENPFIRAGNVGGYKNKMSEELINRFEAWTKENLAGTELSLE